MNMKRPSALGITRSGRIPVPGLSGFSVGPFPQTTSLDTVSPQANSRSEMVL